MRKICIKCMDNKKFIEFPPRSDSKDGRRNKCLKCTASYNKKYLAVNKEKIQSNQKIYLKNNPEVAEKCKVSQKRRYLANNGDILEKQRVSYKKDPSKKKEYYLKNELKIKERNKLRYHKKIKGSEAYDRLTKTSKEWQKRNKDKIRKNKAVYTREKRKTDINFRLAGNLRRNVNCLLNGKRKAGSFIRDLGCTLEFFKGYLESKFLPHMNWGNYGHGDGKWNIDHIFPLSLLDLSIREEFLKASHYTNLQPLWHLDNIRKGNKLPSSYTKNTHSSSKSKL